MGPDDSFEINFHGMTVTLDRGYTNCRVCREKDFWKNVDLSKVCMTITDNPGAPPTIEVDWGKFSLDLHSGGISDARREAVVELLVDLDLLTYGYVGQYVVEVGGINSGPKDGGGGHLHFVRERDAVLWTDANFHGAMYAVRILKIAESIGNEEWKKRADKLNPRKS